MGACQGPPGPRPVQAPRALTPLVARSTSVRRRLRPRLLPFRQLLPLRKAQPAPPVSIGESARTLPTFSHIHRSLAALGAPASLTLAPALGRAVVSALHPLPLLQRSACPCSAVLRVRLLPTPLPRRVSQPSTPSICSPAIPATAGQGCAPVLMAVGNSYGQAALPAVESPSYLAPTSRRPLPAAAYGLARLALFGAQRLRVPDPP